MKNMKAIQMHAFGGPEVLVYEDVPCPVPGDSEILVRVYATGVNPIDWKIREGMFREGAKLPLIPGKDIAGIVEEVGSKVTGFAVRDSVYGFAAQRGGGYAEYSVVNPNEAARKPQSLDYVHAAAVPVAAITAWQALFDIGGLSSRQTVLVHGAAGGVGGFAVQFAKAKGAKVIGTASSDNLDYVKGLGADEVVNYQITRFEGVVQGVDMVLDLIGGDTQRRSWQVLKRGGILVSTIGPPSPPAELNVRGGAVFAQANTSQLTEIGGLIDAGKVKVNLKEVLPLAEARKAQANSQSGHTQGKIVLQVVDSKP